MLAIWMVGIQIAMKAMLDRPELLERVTTGLRQSPVTLILGPRQCGKTTLARKLSESQDGSYYDLESPRDLARLAQPQTALEAARGLVVLDEIHQRPDLLPLLRVLADRQPLPCRFLLLGSASPDLMKKSSETLAGRVHFVDMTGFTLDETGVERQPELWVRGGFPKSFLAEDEARSVKWREDFVQTFLQRDLPMLGIQVPPATLHRFWTMLAHYHGGVWNGSQIGGSLGVSHHAARRYLDALSGAYVVRQLQPWFENIGKRVVKSPKVYIRDSGLLHSLLNISDAVTLQSHPKLGASWEGFVIEQILSWAGERNAYFWGTHSGAELDLMILAKGKRWGIEVKYQDAPTITRSMRIAMQDLKLERLWVVYPGRTGYLMDESIECVSMGQLGQIRKALQ